MTGKPKLQIIIQKLADLLQRIEFSYRTFLDFHVNILPRMRFVKKDHRVRLDREEETIEEIEMSVRKMSSPCTHIIQFSK